MSILQKLQTLKDEGKELIITPQEYQDLCVEVHALGQPKEAEYDALILDYIFNGAVVAVTEQEIA